MLYSNEIKKNVASVRTQKEQEEKVSNMKLKEDKQKATKKARETAKQKFNKLLPALISRIENKAKNGQSECCFEVTIHKSVEKFLSDEEVQESLFIAEYLVKSLDKGFITKISIDRDMTTEGHLEAAVWDVYITKVSITIKW